MFTKLTKDNLIFSNTITETKKKGGEASLPFISGSFLKHYIERRDINQLLLFFSHFPPSRKKNIIEAAFWFLSSLFL